MRRITRGRWILLLLVGLLIPPGTVRAQGYPMLEQAPPSPLIPWPIGKPRMEDGGMFFAGEFLYWTQTNPIKGQELAVRGFIDTNGTLGGGPGGFRGSATEALNTNDVSGPSTFEPGIALYGGWRFSNGVTLEVGWWHVADIKLSATASLAAKNFQVGANGADSFLFSPVFNFPSDYAGPPIDAAGGTAGSTFGIWNAASLMTEQFVQRFDQVTINFHVPYEETDAYRLFGIIGGRSIIMWERYSWRTVDLDQNGNATTQDQATYSNVVSNRWYGFNLGCGGDWYMGSIGPLGAFALTADVQGGLGIDFVKERAGYELGDHSTAATRHRNDYTFSPMGQGDLSFWWYPTQGVSLRLGWQGMVILNTVSSPRPVDFNLGALTPGYERTLRYMHGLHVGVSFVF